jgi:hypothetical protein
MSRQINISVEDKVYDKLTAMARERGYSTSSYAKIIFDAAYAARAWKSGDLHLDTLVGCAIVLWGAQKDTATIAAALKLQESTVTRIISAWRKHFREAA